MNVLVWFRRDLRVADHPALALAAGLGAVLPLYIVDPADWAAAEASARQWAFVAESLADLQGALAGLGAPLVVRVGPPAEVLARLCRAHRITRIVCHAGPGDAGLAAWARAQGIGWEALPPPAPGAAPLLPPGALTPVTGVAPGLIPVARALRLADDRCAHRQAGGRAQGLALLDSFLAARGEGYGLPAAPMVAERASSRLSPHLTHGTLSPAEVAAAVAVRVAERPGGRWPVALRAFRARLDQRTQAPAMMPEGPATPHLAAFAAGETGLPFVDACLRYLRATGWLDDRLRAMLAGVACRHLGIGAGPAGTVLARAFTDYDPAIHWPQMQRIAAGQGARAGHPVRLGQTCDPEGAFLRRWLPELDAVPDAFLHTPWRWRGAPGVLGRRYPEPLVDPAVPLPRPPAAAPRRAPRPRPVPAGQLCLDL
ncbi:FAD-binding domain-containing protein [Ruixingdingia sedimenti]|uniref:FAD-binding domain-containing protein n=1 Tax=Ruixingdingia sedimenti TaxID=3073604 RepID=A0ABU1FAZ3_9RHOB|nr:FAD-binding domain-containing protein [Xinfangfangia sp. LG-4]MDR5654036.1 FAD-binding domain-containing protein [Xinfangfangia sp. LG-4]